jgi:hypothetical protein
MGLGERLFSINIPHADSFSFQDRLAAAGAKWDVTIPASIAPGEYILRHEILGLHVAATVGGAQFVSFVGCSSSLPL